MDKPSDKTFCAANEWDYDVKERVANAVGCIEDRDGDMATLLHLRWSIRELMGTVKMTDLRVPELVAIVAVLAPANGRRLVTDAIEEGLRPILRIVDNGDSIPDGIGDDIRDAAPLDLSEEDTDLSDEFFGGDSVQPVS